MVEEADKGDDVDNGDADNDDADNSDADYGDVDNGDADNDADLWIKIWFATTLQL